jgi:Beta-propeller repeat
MNQLRCYRLILTALLMSALLAPHLSLAATPPPAENTLAAVGDPVTMKARDRYGRFPLYFMPNLGQAPPEVKYYAVSGKRTFLLTRESLVLRLPAVGSTGRLNTLALAPVGLNPKAELVPVEPLPGRVNYFKGQDPKEWRTNLPTYGAVLYREAYPGIDLKVYGTGRHLEYDVVVRPGADPSRVRFRATGVQRLIVNDQGDLVFTLPGGGSITQKKPVVYQEIDGRRVPREGRFQVAAGKTGTYGFALGPYDSRYPLVIDPLVVVYSRIFGGSSDDIAFGVAVDQSGNAYLTGRTYSSDFPGTTGAYQPALKGPQDAFVAKLGPDGTLLAATYLGGTGYDEGYGIAVDSVGNVYVTGTTYSTNFPIVNAYQGTKKGDGDVFVAKLNNTLSSLLYATFLGGGTISYWAEEFGRAIAVDASGNAYVTGYTQTTDFPTKGAFQGTIGGSGDAFVAKINPNAVGAASLVYSSYLGGAQDDDGHAIAVDSSGAAYLAGSTTSSDFPTEKPYQGKLSPLGTKDAFVTKISPDGSAKVYSTYLGGTLGAEAVGIAVDGTGAAYVVGGTESTDFPRHNPIQGTFGGGYDAFITKLALVGDTLTLVYSTYLGGSDGDWATAVAVDGSGAAYILGGTESYTDFPFRNTIPGYFGGDFVTKVNPGGTAWVYATGINMNENTGFRCIAVDSAGQVTAAGRMGPNPTDVLTLKFREKAANIVGVTYLLME